MSMFGAVKTVDDVIANFSKTISDLNAIAEANIQKMTANRLTIEGLETENSNLDAEQSRANAIAQKIEGLLN